MLKRTFIKGRLNKDLDERALPDGEYRDALNIEITDSEGSDVGAIENTLSNKKITNVSLGANPKTIGKYEDEKEDKIYWFVKSDTACFLLEYDAINNITSVVLKDSRVSGSGRVLDLNEDYLITGIVKVISEDTNKDLLLWTDNQMEICCINIERAKTWAENDFEEADIYLIKRQPRYAPEITPTYSSEESNYLEEIFMSFSYRYKYRDGERSALSSFSNYNFNPKTFKMDYQAMENTGMVNAYNAVRITFDTGPKQVTDIEIVAKQSNSNTLYLLNSFNKEDEGWSLTESEEKSFTFSNNKIYQVLAEKELYRTFDNVPRMAKALTLSENIPVIGNYVEGYNIEDENGDSIKLNYVLDVESNDVTGTELDVSFNAGEDELTFTIPSDIELNQKTRLIFNLGLNNDDYDGSYLNTTEFILTEDFGDANELAAHPDFVFFIENVLTNQFLVDYDITVDDGWALEDNTPFSITGSTSTTITIKGIILEYLVDDTPLDTGDNPTNTHTEYLPFLFSDTSDVFFSEIESVASCKTNRDYEVGFVYQDAWSRKTTVLTGDSNTIYIPQKFSTVQNKLLVNIMHNPPYWADSYKLVVKSNPLQYHTIYATVYYPEGVYRWVKLEGANRDKVNEGDTLIVKSDLNGPLTEIIKTRVLEVVTKSSDFIEGNEDDEENDIIEEEGLYMKVKPSGYDMSYAENAIINVDKTRSAGKNRQEKFVQAAMYEAFFDDATAVAQWKDDTDNNSLKKPAISVTEFNNYNDDGTFHSAMEIVAGSQISVYFRVGESSFSYEYDKQFIVASTYTNIKEWWSEEVVDLGSMDDRFDIEFVEQGGEVRILIQGNNTGSAASSKQSKLVVEIDAILVEGLVIYETEPKQAEDYKFYETEQTFDIIDGKHQGNIQNQTDTDHAIVNLDFFNCYIQGNGVESFRVKDAVNTNYLNIDLKPTSTSIEKYREIRRFSDLTYGEGYIESTNMNGINVFNASQANFKELEKQNGSIQFLKTRDRNIVVIQEDKAGYVIFGRDLLTMADGGTVLSGTPEILGEYVPYQGEHGCGKNPESITCDAYRLYYVNPRKGTPIRLSIDGVTEINYGMVSYFRDMFINNPSSKKLGGYDPYHKKFVLTAEDEDAVIYNLSCGNTITKEITEEFQYVLDLNDLTGEIVLSYNITSGNATIQAEYDGDITVVSNTTGTGTITIEREDLSSDSVLVTVTPVSDSVSLEISNTCPIGSAMKLITIVLADETDLGKTIINRFKRGSGSFYSDNHYFSDFEISQFTVEDGLEGVGKFPGSGEVVTMQSFKDTLSTGEFKEDVLNAIGYLVSDTLYDESDINTILSNATYPSITNTELSASSEINSTSFTFTRPSANHNLYMIFDYKDKNEAPVAVSDSVSVNKGAAVDINVLANDSDPDGDDLTPIIVSGPSYGTVSVNPDKTIKYTHNDSDNFSDSFTYKVNDGLVDSNTVAVDVSVGVDCSAGINASGNTGIYEAIVVLGTGTGTTGIVFDAQTVPDRFQIEYDGVIVADSLYVGDGMSGDPPTYGGLEGTHTGLSVYSFNGTSFDDTGTTQDVTVTTSDISTIDPPEGNGTITFNKTTALPTTMKIIVTAPVNGTAWTMSGICPS